MEQERARALLRQERRRLQRLLAAVDADHDRVSTADEVAEDLVDGADRRTSEETDEALARQLTQRLQALRRAEGRLAAGTYGRSVLSGQPIPDERLEAFPLAELTVEEEAAQERADRPLVEALERAADGQNGATVEGEDRAGRDRDQLDAARFGPSREPFQVLDDPAVQDDQLVEDDETTFDEPQPEHDPALPALPDGVAEDDTGRIRLLPPNRRRRALLPAPVVAAERLSVVCGHPCGRSTGPCGAIRGDGRPACSIVQHARARAPAVRTPGSR